VRDTYHQPIKAALQLDGWEVADPFPMRFHRRLLIADLGAERALLGAERGRQQIVVEVKDFLTRGAAYLEQAIGQYLLYRSWLRRIAPERTLYFGVSEQAALTVFNDPAVDVVVQDYDIKLLVVDIRQRRIVRWT
jgi:hypothetical protein